MPRPDLIIINEASRSSGGADRVAVVTAAGLARRGYRVRFVSPDADDARGPDSDLLASGVEVRRLNLRSFYERGEKREQLRTLRGNPDTPDAVLAALDGLDPRRTIAHIHNAGFRLTWTAIAAVQVWGARTIYTGHHYGAACPTSNFFDHPAATPCPRRPLGAACLAYECTGHGRKARLPRILAAIAARGAGVHTRHAAALYPSSLARRILEPYLSEVPHHEVLPNPQDLIRGPASTPSRSDIFLYVGRLVPEKAPDLFLHATEAAGVRARVVGDGPMRAALEREHPKAEFTGWLPPEGVTEEYARARVHVFPSLWPETMGLGILDAASRGVPSIVTEIVGAADWTRTHDAGLLIPPRDLEALTATIEHLKNDTIVDRLGAHAYAALWSDPPTLDLHLDRLERLFAEIGG